MTTAARCEWDERYSQVDRSASAKVRAHLQERKFKKVSVVER